MLLKRFIDVILFGSIFISLCAVALCIETNLLLHLPLNNFSFYLFVFGATLLQYNLHYLFKKTAVNNSGRLRWSRNNKILHIIFIVTGAIIVVVTMFNFTLRHIIIISVLGIITMLYSFPFFPFIKKRIKDFGLLKILTLAFLWTIITVWFPLGEEFFFRIDFQLIFFRRFIFIFTICLLFDIRDIVIDRKKNISTFAVILGLQKSYLLCNILLFSFTILSFIQFFIVNDLIQLIVMVSSAIVTFVIIGISKKNNSDYIYLGAIDGMMFLQALLVIIGSTYFH